MKIVRYVQCAMSAHVSQGVCMDKRATGSVLAAVLAVGMVGGGVWLANAAGERPAEPASQIQVADTPSSTIAPTTTTVEVTTTIIVPVEAPPAPAPAQPKVAPVDTGVVTTPEPPAPQSEPAPVTDVPRDENGAPLNPTPPPPPPPPAGNPGDYTPEPGPKPTA